MSHPLSNEASHVMEPGTRQVLFEALQAQPDLNRHIAIAWARLAGHRCAADSSRITVLQPFAL